MCDDIHQPCAQAATSSGVSCVSLAMNTHVGLTAKPCPLPSGDTPLSLAETRGTCTAARNAHSLQTAACATPADFVNKVAAMASTSVGRLSVEDVLTEVAGIDVDHEEWSDDDFEGYIDDENEQCNQETTERSVADLDIGRECEVGEAEADPVLEIPQYFLPPGWNIPHPNATPLELFKMLLTDSILDGIVNKPTSMPASTSADTISLLG